MRIHGDEQAMRWRSGRLRIGTLRRLACVLMAATFWLGLAAPVEAGNDGSDKPIIAQLIADAGGYDGRSVTIYGLVIEVTREGREFLLQDVSQMPLRVVRADGMPTSVHDQMIVEGVFIANHGDPYLEARKITYEQVLGGCCS